MKKKKNFFSEPRKIFQVKSLNVLICIQEYTYTKEFSEFPIKHLMYGISNNRK